MSRPHPPLVLALCLVLVGCVAGPFAPGVDRSAPVELGNTAADTYRFELSIATVASNLTVRRQDGTEQAVDLAVTTFGARSTPENPITAVDLPEGSRRYGSYTLGPDERTGFVVESVRQDEALVVVVVEPDSDAVHSVHGASCRPVYFTGFEVVVRNGPEAGNRSEPAYAVGFSSSCGG